MNKGSGIVTYIKNNEMFQVIFPHNIMKCKENMYGVDIGNQPKGIGEGFCDV